ncbi:hypothetical protein Bbelb_301160 [Branchiostoma belcheri]|nr:hypothetical protein Bbelb_301160 [Branchiostoma belcheri]
MLAPHVPGCAPFVAGLFVVCCRTHRSAQDSGKNSHPNSFSDDSVRITSQYTCLYANLPSADSPCINVDFPQFGANTTNTNARCFSGEQYKVSVFGALQNSYFTGADKRRENWDQKRLVVQHNAVEDMAYFVFA